MKKQMKLTLLSLVFINSIPALAETDDDISIMINQGKIEAAMAAQAEADAVSEDLGQGKIEATALMNMKLMVEEASQSAEEIRKIADSVADSMEDSQGLLHALGQFETQAAYTVTEMKELNKKSSHLQGESVFQAHEKMSHLAAEVRELAKEALSLKP